MSSIRIKNRETHLESVLASAHREGELHVDDVVGNPTIISAPTARQGTGVGLGHELLRLRRPAIDLKGQSEGPVVSQVVEGRRDLDRDRDAPLLGVEKVEVVLAIETPSTHMPSINLKNTEHPSCTTHGRGSRSRTGSTYTLGPAPAEKLRSSPPRGQGVTPEPVLPSPGMLTQVRPLTVVFRAAWEASMANTPSLSTKPRLDGREERHIAHISSGLNQRRNGIRTVEATRHRLVFGVQDDVGRLGLQALRRSLDGDPRSLRAAELAPVDGEENPLLRRARGNRAGGGGDLKPRRVARRRPGEGSRTARADVDEAVPEGVVVVDGHHRASACRARGAAVLVVSRPTGHVFVRGCARQSEMPHAPSTHASLDGDPHWACKVLLLRLHRLH